MWDKQEKESLCNSVVQKTVNNGMRMAESINIQHTVEIPGVVIAWLQKGEPRKVRIFGNKVNATASMWRRFGYTVIQGKVTEKYLQWLQTWTAQMVQIWYCNLGDCVNNSEPLGMPILKRNLGGETYFFTSHACTGNTTGQNVQTSETTSGIQNVIFNLEMKFWYLVKIHIMT